MASSTQDRLFKRSERFVQCANTCLSICLSTNLFQPRLAGLLHLKAISMIAIPDCQHHLEPQKFRFALVIEEAHSLRNSVVKVLKAQDWFVHGILRGEQALHILAYIPYRLIVIDSDLPGICGIDFVRILHNSREWREIQLVVITSSQSTGYQSKCQRRMRPVGFGSAE